MRREFAVGAGMNIVEALVASKMCSSKSDARAQIEQGSVKIDGAAVSDIKATVVAGTVTEGQAAFRETRMTYAWEAMRAHTARRMGRRSVSRLRRKGLVAPPDPKLGDLDVAVSGRQSPGEESGRVARKPRRRRSGRPSRGQKRSRRAVPQCG